MIHCKKHIIATCLSLMIPLTVWSEAAVVDDSDNFAMMDEQPSVVHPKYDEPQYDTQPIEKARKDNYRFDESQEDGPALVKEDAMNESAPLASNDFNDNAKLIEKVQSLQKELQELRGQLEVQAHDLKLLQQQQVAFYKDLDSRLGSTSGSSLQAKPATDLNLGGQSAVSKSNAPVPQPKEVKTKIIPQPVASTSHVNPADEQISYMAAYELVKNRMYDEAINAMQNFVQKYPNGGYTANAEYWLGELYLVKKNYPKAIEHFDVVLKQFPSSSKSAASLLKSGYAYVESGNNQEAKKRFQQVVSTYPNTPTAQLASSKLQTLKSI